MNEIPGVTYASPYTFPFKQKLALALLPPTIALCLKGLAATCRKETLNSSHWEAVRKSSERVIVAIWHESMGLGACHYRNTAWHTLTSYSYDGELAARIVRYFGILAVRGSSSRGGAEALEGLAVALKQRGVIGFTLDGPKGPRRIAKAGIAILAARTNTPIIPHAFTVRPAWRLNSWDRFPVPKPFARIISAYGPAIPPPDDYTPEAIEHTRLRVEQALNALHAEIEGPELPS